MTRPGWLAVVVAGVGIAVVVGALVLRPDPVRLGVDTQGLRAAPVPVTDGATAVWTGHEFIVFGGSHPGGGPEGAALSNRGAAYDPATRRWRALPPAPIDPRTRHTAAWTGDEMLVWGGTNRRHGIGDLLDGAAYDPAADTWRRIADAPAKTDRSRGQAVVSGGIVVIGGGAGSTPAHDRTILLYDVGQDKWAAVTAPAPVLQVEQVGTEVLVLSGIPGAPAYTILQLDVPAQRLEPVAELDFDRPLFTGGLLAQGHRAWFIADRFNGPASVGAIDRDSHEVTWTEMADEDLEGPLMLYGDSHRQPTLELGDHGIVVLGRGGGDSRGLAPDTGQVAIPQASHPWLCANGGTYAVDGARLFTWGGTTCRAGDTSEQAGALTTYTWVEPR